MTESLTLAVGGMTCAACQSRVQRALQEAPGVESATVNLMLANAAVRYDPLAISPAQLLATVRATGYDAELPIASLPALLLGLRVLAWTFRETHPKLH